MFNEQPLYILHQSLARAVIPKIISLVFLGIIFYLGVLLNLSLLQLPFSENIIKVSSALFLALLICLGVILTVYQARQPYTFFADKIVSGKEVRYYQSLSSPVPSEDILDRLFHTQTIALGQNFFLRHIPNTLQIPQYLNQLSLYSQRLGRK